MKERRVKAERRGFNFLKENLYSNSRRRQPDRRLNNILVEWVPMELVSIHPVTRQTFCKY